MSHVSNETSPKTRLGLLIRPWLLVESAACICYILEFEDQDKPPKREEEKKLYAMYLLHLGIRGPRQAS